MTGTPDQEHIERCLDRALEPESDVELVEYRISRAHRPHLRVFLYKPTGITVEDCARINRRLLRAMESDEELAGRYSVEVSSPGLDRKLVTRRDFERAVGEVVRVRYRHQGGVEQETTGLLTEVEAGALLLETPRRGRPGEGAGEPYRVPLEGIIQGTIVVEL
jgi:ribosome maturation factor RimP